MSRNLRGIAAALVLSLTALAALAVPAAAAPAGSVQLTVPAGPLDVLAAPCGSRPLEITLTNTGAAGAFVDVFITPEDPLVTSHEVISTYVPPDDSLIVRANISAPTGSAGGTHDVAVRLGARGPRAESSVAVTPKPSGPGANLALGGPVSASSTHGNFSVCGAVDGNTNSEEWDTLTGWNDGTSRVWPDLYTVEFGAAKSIDRIVLYTLNSARYPAARYGLRDFDIQVLIAGEWTTVSTVRGNTRGMHELSLNPPVSATSARVLTLASNSSDYSRIVELEVFQSAG
jgi:F5/8 type C domain-containing protein